MIAVEQVIADPRPIVGYAVMAIMAIAVVVILTQWRR